jgi:hypothetical protein
MKVRAGFVSNSSSSSFVVASNKPPILTIRMELAYDLELSTKEELIEYYRNERDEEIQTEEDMLNSDYADEYKEALEALADGKKIYIGRVSNEDYDDATGMYLYNKGHLPGNSDITIIQDLD